LPHHQAAWPRRGKRPETASPLVRDSSEPYAVIISLGILFLDRAPDPDPDLAELLAVRLAITTGAKTLGLLLDGISTMHALSPRRAGLITVVLFLAFDPAVSADPPGQKLADYFGFLPIELYKLDTRIANLTLKDVDGDGVEDIIVTNNGRSRIDLLLSTKKPADDRAARPFRKDVNEVEFDRRMRLVSIPVNKEVASIDFGDFNGDGKPDLVYYGTPAEVEILFNEGPGQFGNLKKVNTGDALERPSSLAVCDLDQDGRDDIALLGDKELIFVYQTADGSLGEPERVPHTVASPWLLKAVDLDGNGAKDLVILDTASDHALHVRFATPEKKLGPEQRFALEAPRAVTFAQMNGKGGSEILALEGQSGRCRVLSLDDSGSESGDERGRLEFFALPQGNERGRSLAIGDIDGDSRADVIVTDPANAQVWVFFQSAKAGLSAGQSYPSLGNARTVRLGRRKGTGGSEVYVLSDSEKQIGRSTFDKGRLGFPTPIPTSGEPVAMDLATLDRDQSPEVLYVARTRPKPGTESFELRAVSGDTSGNLRPFKWGDVESVALSTLSNLPAAIKAVDINQDALTDVIVFNQYGSPILLLGQKDAPPRLYSGSLGPLSGASAPNVSLMNLDGPAAIVAQNTFARRILLDSKGQWNIKDQYNAGRNSAQIVGAAALDTDGDGIKEVVLLDRASKSLLFLSFKNGVYRPAGVMSIGTLNFDGMHVADLNGDGRDDLLVAGTDRFAVLESGRKSLRFKAIASYEPKRTEARLADLAAGDVNSDGCPDVVFSDVAEQSLEIATYAGDKELLPAITFKIFERKSFRNAAETLEPRDMTIGDVDGDGRSDLVLIVHDRVVVYRQDPGKPAPKTGPSSSKPPVAARSGR